MELPWSILLLNKWSQVPCTHRIVGRAAQNKVLWWGKCKRVEHIYVVIGLNLFSKFIINFVCGRVPAVETIVETTKNHLLNYLSKPIYISKTVSKWSISYHFFFKGTQNFYLNIINIFFKKIIKIDTDQSSAAAKNLLLKKLYGFSYHCKPMLNCKPWIIQILVWVHWIFRFTGTIFCRKGSKENFTK